MSHKEICSTFVSRTSGQTIPFIYRDLDAFDELKGTKVKGVHGFCFCGDKLVIVYAENKGSWGPPGGGIEPGETIEEAVVREVFEETNMRVLKQQAIGYMEILEPERTLGARSVCIVEPIGEFISDPDGDVTEIKLIDPQDAKKYFDWGESGDAQLERALLLKETL
ncbi:MAG: NUDIX domain-containing protein [Candidatus Paceibacterota bacterium]|jgi:8-oxo-dGTP pyrophosphatase MutT (NUDIX family)